MRPRHRFRHIPHTFRGSMRSSTEGDTPNCVIHKLARRFFYMRCGARSGHGVRGRRELKVQECTQGQRKLSWRRTQPFAVVSNPKQPIINTLGE
eukprot:1761344-Pyramimonas_sp.AAC.1